MKIINIIEIRKGVVDTPFSWVIPEKKNEELMEIDKIERIFADKAYKNGASLENIDTYLDDGYFINFNGYEILIKESILMI